jgi:hypothetical protein
VLTEQEFRALLSVTGEPVVWKQAKAPQATANVRAIVQTIGSVKSAEEVIVNAYGVTGRSIQVAARDLPVAPEKFDEITCQGERYIIETVLPQHSRQTGTITYFLLYSKGRSWTGFRIRIVTGIAGTFAL